VPGGRDTGCSQFVLWLEPNRDADPQLIDKENPTGGVTVFGRVVAGMDVLSKLREAAESRSLGQERDKIVQATVLNKRKHPYTVQKIGEKAKPESTTKASDEKTEPAGKADGAKTPPAEGSKAATGKASEKAK